MNNYKKKWSAADDEYIIRHWPTEDLDVIQQHLGRTKKAIANRASVLGVRREREYEHYSHQELTLLKQMCREGRPWEEIAQRLNRALPAIKQKAYKEGLKTRVSASEKRRKEAVSAMLERHRQWVKEHRKE